MSTNDELAAALLPAEAFGPAADAVSVDVRQVTTGAGGDLPQGASVTPQCGEGVGGTAVSPEDFGVVVAQAATTDADVTVELLAESEQADAAGPRFADLVEQCRQVTITAPDGSSATVDLAALAVPDLGDASDGVRFTTAVRAPDGTNLTVPSLLAVATDGQRLLYLQRTGTGSAPLDEGAFTDLFALAFETQQTP
ncbi:hypothetical protein DQ238_04215 [Geodermatophilus sp. TF02-6]|uniref:hypothetical protein n=1 Tax=Geodermatophilus sp. TF02-6 TaxID=2250575 RepID=UPI000DEB2D08|nr:hypothetical protein [Geodermatophilus sp. TF02-6]RBY82498.1 hypothetical protein DQ238_04215 [Geodermatophilus sp. TF02-6]